MINRRRWLTGSIASTAAVAGMGVAWWQARADAAVDLSEMWAMHFERPDGGELDMATLRGKPLLINFWATWCAPCLREMPAFDAFHRQFEAKGWQVLGLAVDSPAPVREFLGKVKVNYPMALAGLDGTDLIAKLGNLQGGLPFSVMIDSQGRLAHQRMGETNLGELTAWANKAR